MAATLPSQTYQSGFDPDIRALFEQSFGRMEQIGFIGIFDPSMLESVDLPLIPKLPRRTTIEELLKLYEA